MSWRHVTIGICGLAFVGAAVRFSAVWPAQTEAAAGSLSFFAAIVVALAAWGTLQASREQGIAVASQAHAAKEEVRVLRERWDEERKVHLDLWPRTVKYADVYVLRRPGEPVARTQMVRAEVVIWNHGRHMVRIVGFSLTKGAAPFPGTTRTWNMLIGAEGSVELDFNKELLELFGLDGVAGFDPGRFPAATEVINVGLLFRGVDGVVGWTASFALRVNPRQGPPLDWGMSADAPPAVAAAGRL